MAGNLFADFFQFADVFAFLVLSAAGLAIIFGMMGVINMAHGEFIMAGAYVTASTFQAGLPLPLAQVCGTLAAAVLGILLEITVIRRLYSRPLNSLLVTFGISLIVTQGTLLVLGSTFPGIGTPGHAFTVGHYTFSSYRVELFLAALWCAGLCLSVLHAHELRALCAGDHAGCRHGAGTRGAQRAGLRDELRYRRRPGRTCVAPSMPRQ